MQGRFEKDSAGPICHLFRMQEERNPWLYVNTDNLRESVRDYAVSQNVIKGLREGTARGKQIWMPSKTDVIFWG